MTSLVLRPVVVGSNRLALGKSKTSLQAAIALITASMPPSERDDDEPLQATDCVLACSSCGALAVARGQGLVVVPSGSSKGVLLQVRFDSPSSSQPALNLNDTITALCWMPPPSAAGASATSPTFSSSSSASDSSILLVGFSNGLVRAYLPRSASEGGGVLFTQRLQDGPVRRLRLRRRGRGASDLLVLHSRSLAWVEGRSLATSIREASDALEACQGRPHNEGADLTASSAAWPWAFRAWAHAAQAIEDVLPCAPLVQAEFGFFGASAPSQNQPCFVAAGSDPALAFFAPEDDDSPVAGSGSGVRHASHSHSTRGAIKLVAKKLGSAVFSMAKTWWHSDEPAAAAATQEMAPLPDPDEIELDRCIRDANRQVLTLASDPLTFDESGPPAPAAYALAADNFGRVTLLDLQAFVLVRMWKGYRDAQCCLVRQHPIGPQIAASTSAPASASSPAAAASPSPSAPSTKPSAKPKKSKLTIVQHASAADEEDGLLDFDSPAPAIVAPLPAVAASSAPATLSTRVPSVARPPPPPLHMLLYAPRRGQLELWALPYGARIGAAHVGTGCVLMAPPDSNLTQAERDGHAMKAAELLARGVNIQAFERRSATDQARWPAQWNWFRHQLGAAHAGLTPHEAKLVYASWRSAQGHPPPDSECAQLVRPDGSVQVIHITALVAPPKEESPTTPLDAAQAEDEACIADTERSLLAWSRAHSASCGGFACALEHDQMRSVLSPLSQWAQALASRCPPTTEKEEWATPPLLPSEHVVRMCTLLMASATRLWTSFSGSSDSASNAGTLCPRLCEATLQAALQLVETALQLAAPPETVEVVLSTAREDTTLSFALEHTQATQGRAGFHLRAPSPSVLAALQLKQMAQGWLHLLAAYHTACAPAGHAVTASSSASMSLRHFLACFRSHVVDLLPSLVAIKPTGDGATSPSTTSVHQCTLRFGLSSALALVLAASGAGGAAFSSSAYAPAAVAADTISEATLAALCTLLLGRTSPPALFQASDHLAAASLDLFVHLDASAFDRAALHAIVVHWWTAFPPQALAGILDPSDSAWALPRDQLQLLLAALIKPVGATPKVPEGLGHLPPLAPLGAFLSSLVLAVYRSASRDHAAALLRFARSAVLRPALQAYRRSLELHDEATYDNAPTSEGAGALLKRGLNFLSMMDASTRVLHRHMCQLSLLRGNFPASAVEDRVLTLRRFVASHPLARLVVMHMLRNGGAAGQGQEVLDKEELRAKLHSFESVLQGAADDAQTAEPTEALQVASLLSVRSRAEVGSKAVASSSSVPETIVSIPIASWDWSLTSDEASVYIYASLHSLQRFFQAGAASSVAPLPAPASTHDLVAAVCYLEYAPMSAVSGGLAVFIWNEVLAPHIRALVHAAYPEAPTPVVPERPSSSASSLAAVAAAAKAKKASAGPVTFMKLLKTAAISSGAGGPTPTLIDFSDLESLRAIFLCSQRVLAYVGACFTREDKDQAWEGADYFCPAIAQTLDRNVPHAIPIRQADQPPQAVAGKAVADAQAPPAIDRFTSALVLPEDGPPSSSSAPSLCTSLFHAHVRYTHPESSIAPFANLPSGLYARLTSFYQATDLDRSMADLLRLVEVLSAHVELDVPIASLATLNATVGSMFQTHLLVRDAQAFRSLAPTRSHIFPRLHEQVAACERKRLDIVEWITQAQKWIDAPLAPSVPVSSSSSSSSSSKPAPALVALAPVAPMTARLSFLMSLLKERSALSTAPVVFALSEVLALPPGACEALLREHVLLLYERGEDVRAWEAAPKLDDPVALATALIAIGRTRLGLFLHALESKHAPKYAQLVSAVPAQAWQWLAKAKPPHVMSKRPEEEQAVDAAPATASSSSSTPVATVAAVAPVVEYVLSGLAPLGVVDPLHLVLTRAVSIKQKEHDIDIHATLTLLRRSKAMLEQALVAPRPPAKNLLALPPVQGEPFGREGDNAEQLRSAQPLRYARAYASQLVDIASMVVRGIGGRA